MLERAGSHVTFVGAPTVGANGNVTEVALPGGYYISFSGLGVQHADGRQLQRVGIQPNVRISPTLDGVRAGRDEALETALRLAERG
jgi:C-terminal processing protease CtpA/Prc